MPQSAIAHVVADAEYERLLERLNSDLPDELAAAAGCGDEGGFTVAEIAAFAAASAATEAQSLPQCGKIRLPSLYFGREWQYFAKNENLFRKIN